MTAPLPTTTAAYCAQLAELLLAQQRKLATA